MNILIVIFLVVVILTLSTFVIFTLRSLIKGAPFVATTDKLIQEMVKLATIQHSDVMCDLGSGDGRILVAFVRRGVKGHGFEHNPFLVVWSRFLVHRAKLERKAFIHWGNFWKEDLSKFDIVTVFGISYIMKSLEKKLKKELKPGAKVISVGFKFPSWKTTKQQEGLYLYLKR